MAVAALSHCREDFLCGGGGGGGGGGSGGGCEAKRGTILKESI